MVKTFGDQLLARAPLADHQHRPVQGRGAARPLDRVEEAKLWPMNWSVRSMLSQSENCPTVGGKSHQLARIFTLFLAANQQILRNSALYEEMARPLYGIWQV